MRDPIYIYNISLNVKNDDGVHLRVWKPRSCGAVSYLNKKIESTFSWKPRSGGAVSYLNKTIKSTFPWKLPRYGSYQPL